MDNGIIVAQYLKLARLAHQISLSVCIILLAFTFAAQVAVVMLRYFLSIGFVELQDFVLYCFAMLSVLGLPVSLRMDTHVRVDVFRKSGATRVARNIDRLSYLIFLLPLMAITFYFVMPLVSYSWSIQEGSRETGGLAGYYLVMTIVPIFCVLMILQAGALFLDRKLIHSYEAA